MRGHDSLIAMRRRGIRPVLAFLSDGMDDLGMWRDWPAWTSTAHLEVQPGDALHRLDLRCLVGMVVMVSGTDAERVRALHERCVECGARRVLSAVMAWCGEEMVAVDRFETLEAA